MELSNESLTIRFTDIGRNDQIISNLLLNPEFLKGTLNIQVFSGEMLSTGLASEIFQLSGSGATGLGENTSTVKFRKISPGETIQVTFNLLDAMKQVRNPKLAAYLAKKSIDFCLIFPISPDLLGSTDRGTIDFHSPDVVYNLR